MIENDSVRVGAPGPRPVHLFFSDPTRPFGDPTLDFLVKALGPWVSIETPVRTRDGDGLDTFLSSLAEDDSGWEGPRAWQSLEHGLTILAEYNSAGFVHLTWGIHDRPPSETWHFETTTVHAAGEEMRSLAAALHTFLANSVE
ncbi:DUF6228 family protein [Streptomyces sp. NPDC059193]|uniref:DUF6228 family protein n=1 Tax=Streptomyces sp. NPDC059193 TaxID=3346763 RepID=UPI0036C43B2E